VAAHRLASRRVIQADAEVQVDPAALEFELVDLALAVLLTAGLEGQELPGRGGGAGARPAVLVPSSYSA
jgi:hypothetical protein